jgi:hypothetical protein
LRIYFPTACGVPGTWKAVDNEWKYDWNNEYGDTTQYFFSHKDSSTDHQKLSLLISPYKGDNGLPEYNTYLISKNGDIVKAHYHENKDNKQHYFQLLFVYNSKVYNFTFSISEDNQNFVALYNNMADILKSVEIRY